MACCILTAVVMNKLIQICDAFDLQFIQIRYNDDDEEDYQASHTAKASSHASCHISIAGMTCASCVSSITRELESIKGVFRANVSLALGHALVSYELGSTNTSKLVDAVRNAGYNADLGKRSSEQILNTLRQSDKLQLLRKSITSASICASLLLGLEYALQQSHGTHFPIYSAAMLKTIMFILTIKAQIFDAWFIHVEAWTKSLRRIATMDSLLSISLLLSVSLFVLGEAFPFAIKSRYLASSGSSLVVVVLAGKYLEAVLQRQSNSKLAALYELQSEKIAYQLSKKSMALPASLLQKNDDILIPVHTRVPCDAYIVHGQSLVDEATITGESLPVSKGMGDFVLAGTTNVSHPLRVVICQEQGESAIAKVIEGITTASDLPTEGNRALNYMMQVFVSCILALAFFAFTWELRCSRHASFLQSFVAACERSASVLAAACPCGIGLATPSAAMAGVDAAFAHGVLLTGGINTMEALQKATHVVMDKTGTLTDGKVSVLSCHFQPDLQMRQQLCYQLLAAAEVEDARVHPVAKAIFKWAMLACDKSEDLTTSPLANIREAIRLPGLGIQCDVNSQVNEWVTVHVGSPTFLQERNIRLPQLDMKTPAGTSVVMFSFNRVYAGCLFVQDRVRVEAPMVVDRLKEAGLKVTMLTGDSQAAADRVSKSLGIPVSGARASPTDKMQFVRDVQQRGDRVVMIGDGLNDTLAQATADVGISISLTQGCFGGAGGIIILSSNLRTILTTFAIAQKVVTQARFNKQWALLYNLVALSLTLGFFERWGICITPAMAGTMMALSSVSVLSMSLYLRHRLKVDLSLAT